MSGGIKKDRFAKMRYKEADIKGLLSTVMQRL